MHARVIVLVLCALGLLIVGLLWWLVPAEPWSNDEKQVLKSLWLGSLPPLAPDPSNKFSDDPRAAEFGHRLFFDVRLSKNGKVACATCHIPALNFTDGLKVSKGVGMTARNAPTIVGSAYSPWFFWDGRKDSQWSQALGPIENPVEHGFSRGQTIQLLLQSPVYRKRYIALFGPLPDPSDPIAVTRAFANLGKAIAAYERKIMPGASKFDFYVEAMTQNRAPAPAHQLTTDEIAGLKLFIGEAHCLRCHNGPLFSNFDFHNTGLPTKASGRASGITAALKDEFNCQSAFSDAPTDGCAELKFAKIDAPELSGAFKSPSLRNLSKTAPYMHAGQFASLDQVLDHYNRAPKAQIGHSELVTLNLSAQQLNQIKAFLLTLNGGIAADEHWVTAPN